MKKYYIFLLLINLSIFKTKAQVYNRFVTFLNKDKKTLEHLTEIEIAAGSRAFLTGIMKDQLTATTRNMRAYDARQYTLTNEEKQFNKTQVSSIVNQTATTALSASLASFPRIPYMSFSKRKFIERHNGKKGLLLPLFLSSFKENSNVISDNRHEVYRLKKEILKQISKKDIRIGKQIAMSILGLLVIREKMGNSGSIIGNYGSIDFNAEKLRNLMDFKSNIDIPTEIIALADVPANLIEMLSTALTKASNIKDFNYINGLMITINDMSNHGYDYLTSPDLLIALNNIRALLND
jgi:hypothetical protein